jgi:hypothetical protein
LRIERNVTYNKSGKTHHEIVYGLTSLDPEFAVPARIGSLARGHWEIENKLHWERDVVYDEDRSQVRTGQGPRALAGLRNFAIGCLRLAGSSIAKGLRWLGWNWSRVLALLGL